MSTATLPNTVPGSGIVPFTVDMHVRWADVDANGHMRTVAYLEWCEDSRMQFFASVGFPMTEFARLGIGPVIQNDELRYRAEMRLLDAGTIELTMDALADDGSRFRMRNDVRRVDGTVAATVLSNGGWLDLAHRRLTVPPAALLNALLALPRSSAFEALPNRRTP